MGEGSHSHSHPKRSHKARGATKKQAEKGSSILKFSEAADVVNAAIKIQGAYRGYRARVEIREHHDSIDLPDEPTTTKTHKKAEVPKPASKKKATSKRAAWADVVNAVITIQKAYRKYRRNKILYELGHESDCDGAEAAVVKIQAHFKGFQARKKLSEPQPVEELKTQPKKPKQKQQPSIPSKKVKALPPGPLPKQQTEKVKEKKEVKKALTAPKKR